MVKFDKELNTVLFNIWMATFVYSLENEGQA